MNGGNDCGMLSARPTRCTRMQTNLSLRRYPAESLAHRHDGWHQLVVARRGVLEMEVQGTAGRVDAGAAALVPAGHRHGFRPLGSGEFLVLDWPVERVAAAPAALFERRRPPYLAFGPEQAALADFLALRVAAGDEDSALVAAGAALLLESLARPGGRATLPAPLRAAMAFLHRHLAQPVTATDAARAAGISTSRLHALFRTWLADTPRGWLTARRLERARSLLTAPAGRRGDLERLAAETGYADASTLARAFRARYGLSPGEYRRRARTRPAVTGRPPSR